MSNSWRCESVWDGIDFTPCFRDHYIANIPLALVAISAAFIVPLALIALFRRGSPHSRPTASSLVSPVKDTNLSRLEANVLIISLAGNVLPAPVLALNGHANGNGNGHSNGGEVVETAGDNRQEDTLPVKEAEKVLEDFRQEVPADVGRWHRVKWWVRMIGALAVLGVAIARAVVQHSWKEVVFPAWIAVLALSPKTPVAVLVTFHLAPSVLLFRSDIIQPDTSLLSLAPAIVELVYWSALISIPYAEPMHGVLEGGLSHGGGSMGGLGHAPGKHIEEPTSAFSRATYTFILPLLYKHFWEPLKVEDIPAIREDDGAAAATAGYRAHVVQKDLAYAKRHKGALRKRNLAKDLFTFFRPILFQECAWMTVFIALVYLPPQGLKFLLKFIADRKMDPSKPVHVAVVYVAMMAAGQSISALALGQALMLGRRVCIRLRAIIIAEVFAKALRRQDVVGKVKKASVDKDGNPVPATDAAASATEGKIANIVSTDSFQISEICAYCFYLWSSPLAIIVNSFLLYNTLGVAAFAGIAVLVLLIPLQALVGKFYTIFTRRLLAATDARLDAVTEVIAHIKLIKFNAWETKFLERMGETRTKELKALAQRFGLLTCGSTLVWATPVLVTAAAFSVHVLILNEDLTADKAFSSLVLFNMLRDPMGLAMDTVTRLLQAYASCQRIQAFLDEPDTLKYEQLSAPGHSDPQIGFRDALFGYSNVDEMKADEGETFRLGELDLSFPVGKLSLVIGPVGSGKTTLITSLLGETVLLSGKVFMPDDRASRDLCPLDANGLRDTVAYCAQTPWLIGASIKDNITFGTPWNAERYDAVVDACALRRDFEIFDLGDETEVGEKGTTCSGGQKARIALARAVYSSAKTLILDDVLSAVDAQTARHLFDHILQGPLLKGRTCILVTHAVPLVAPAAEFIVSLDAGKVMASGTPAELVASGALEEFPPSEPASYAAAVKAKAPAAGDASRKDGLAEDTTTIEPAHDIIEEVLDGDDAKALEAKKQADADDATPETKKLDKKLTATEEQGTGAISPHTYVLYFKAMGSFPFWFLLSIGFVGTQALQISTNAWIKDWANASNDHEQASALQNVSLLVQNVQQRIAESPQFSTQFYLGVYCALAATYTFGLTFRVGFSFVGSLHASRELYGKLLRRILGAKMRFFDSTPSGRIMNRLSKDITSIDTEATEILVYFTNTVLSCLAILIVVVVSTPAFIFALIIIIALYWVVGGLYVATSREMKRHDSVTRSPIFVSFSEVLVGMSTIRSYGDSGRFMRKLMNEVDQNTRCFWYLWQANRVLNNLSNFVGTFVTVSACVFALRSENLSAGLVGMSITYALSFTEFVLWVVRLYAASEMSMNSVERVAEYLELDVEEEEHEKGIEPPAYWPSRDGSVVVENLTCRYAPQLDPVLRDVSFTIAPKEKIGICGRTGSGKSTLALSFFRFLHQESGRIMIDGQDIGKLSLTTLRSRLTILPQEAQLFSGSIRDNLDPFNQHEDLEVWESLRQCGLAGKTPSASRAVSRAVSRAPSVKDLPEMHAGEEEEEVEERVIIRSLDEKVAVGGKNFSQGQRQLLALARGLLKLRGSSFLIMDESTANLDHATDATIQNVLRSGLPDTQMLVIAHRLMTVCGLDKILVLDHGRVIEFGTPWELLQDEHGSFRDLCRQSGEETQLFELAKQVHDSKSKNKSASASST